MITAEGYSKDAGIMPEAIVITFGMSMITANGGLKTFLKDFEECMQEDSGCIWLHKMTNRPKIEFDHIYISLAGRLYGRVYFGNFESGPRQIWTGEKERMIDWPRMIISGPLEKCPFKRQLKGFQGFRYCTKLF